MIGAVLVTFGLIAAAPLLMILGPGVYLAGAAAQGGRPDAALGMLVLGTGWSWWVFSHITGTFPLVLCLIVAPWVIGRCLTQK